MAEVYIFKAALSAAENIGHLNIARQVLWLQMSITSVFGMGSDGSAAGGRIREMSEWLRSVGNDAASSARRTPGTATGQSPGNSCRTRGVNVRVTYFHG